MTWTLTIPVWLWLAIKVAGAIVGALLLLALIVLATIGYQAGRGMMR